MRCSARKGTAFLLLALLATALLLGCADAAPRGFRFGARCTRTEDCASGLCVQVTGTEGVCSETCSTDADCPTAPNWGCVKPAEIDEPVCGCMPTGPYELCGDGLDNDCDTEVDDCRLCDGRPVSENDPRHCGECGNACALEQDCYQETCFCPPTEAMLCGAECVDVQTDTRFCGSCNEACNGEQACIDGRCECPGTSPTACGDRCVDTESDERHCGACDSVCPSAQSCNGGACECPSDVPTLCGDRCVDTDSDPSFCGSCTAACEDGQVCEAGECTCPLATSHYCAGVGCVDLQSDPDHCGACDRSCVDGQVCTAGTCACPAAAYADHCPGVGCVDLSSDVEHCGSCGNACPVGLVCSGGACGCEAANATICGGQCVVTSSDAAHCGGCGNACPGGQYCWQGACACPTAGATACADACVLLDADVNHCGQCDAACAPGEVCESGGCVCWSNLHCGGACVPVNDNSNCGACGNACGSGQFCSGGQCVCGTFGLTACGAQCVDTQTAEAHCGGCDAACPAAQFCSSGSCVCPLGQTFCPAVDACFDLSSDRQHCGTCATACGANQECVSGTCKDLICTPSQSFCSGTELRLCDATGTSAFTVEDCSGTRYCRAQPAPAACANDVCLQGQPVCDGLVATTCATDGSSFNTGGTDCGALGEACDQGACYPIVCAPSVEACVAGDAHHCNALGTVLTTETCASEEYCWVFDGVATCLPDVCTPNEPTCDGTIATTCMPDGSGHTPGGYECGQLGKLCSVGRCCWWGAPTIVAADPAEHSYQPSVAIDAADNVVVTFTRALPGENLSVYAIRFDATLGTWSAPVPLENDSTLDVSIVKVVSDALGNAYALWTWHDASVNHVVVARYDVDSDTWGAPVQMDTMAAAFQVDLAVAPNGDVLVAWFQRDTVGAPPYTTVRWFTAQSETWGPATPLEPPNDVYMATMDTILIDGTGNAMILGSSWGLKWFWLDSGTQQWSEGSFPGGTGPSSVLSAVMAPDGHAVVLYNQDSQLYRREFDAPTLAWTAPELVDSAPKAAAVTIDGQGNWLSAWITGSNVRASRRDAGDLTWPAGMTVGSMSGATGSIWARIGHDGNAHLLWTTQPNINTRDIWIAWHEAAKQTWVAGRLETRTGYANPTSLLLTSDDRVLAFWSQRDDLTMYAIWSSEFSCQWPN